MSKLDKSHEELSTTAQEEQNGTTRPTVPEKIQRVEDIPSLSDLPPQEIEFLIEGYIGQGSVTLVAGPAGSGKSTWALAIAGAVSKGKPFAGLKTKQRPVLYLDRENPQPIAQQRLRDQKTRTGPNFRYWGLWLNPEPPLLSDQIIYNYVESCEIKPLIIFDSLAAFNLADENSATEIRKFLTPARHLANKFGASVLIIHHTGKAPTSQVYRGSSAIADSVDVLFNVKNGSPTDKLERLNVTAEKTRFLVTQEQDFLYRDGRFICDKQSDADEQLRELLRLNPKINGTNLQKEAEKQDIRRSRVRKFLQEGLKHGTINCDPGPKRSKLYTIVEQPARGRLPVMFLSDILDLPDLDIHQESAA